MPDDSGVSLCGMAPEANVDNGPQTRCEKCGESICPKCGAHCSQGYGLAFGGRGAYTACNECDYFYKMQEINT